MTEEKTRFVSLMSDTTIKYLYQTDAGKKWLDNLIKETTGVDLSDYKLEYSELPSGNKNTHDMRTDFLLENNKDVAIIEVQNSSQEADKGYLYLFRVN